MKRVSTASTLEPAITNAHKDKVSYHHEYRKELLEQASKAVGATYGNIH